MTGLEHLVVLGAGLVAGIMTSTVGVSSLLSFPVLLALGIPPVVANASNAVGLTPGAITGSFGYRTELREHPRVATTIIGTCAIGAAGGALLLLALPPGVFEAVVPWLILGTCLLVGAQPRISSWLRRSAAAVPPDEHTRLSPVTTFFAVLVGVYGGYFGAGSGVMMMAVLGFGSHLEFRSLNALKTLAVLACNLVASVVFVAIAELDWTAVVLLAAGSIVGGYVGARIGRRLNPTLLRSLIVVVGVTAAVRMLTS
ncbi:sulfite exporter TauE/SafE family protein [Nocardioides conyzicola]|uniref:Probable membrane transporter protein n=1 Tax=Nocardioides conyzicola TaxID=1651781 RepID=A0ABP8WZT9_9ACTN